MADLPISSLPELTAITQNAEFAVAQGGTTYKVKNSTLSPFPTVYGLFSQTGNSAVVSATTIETTIIDGGVGTLSVPANGFQIGDSFRVIMGGVINAGNNEDIQLRVKSDSVVLADSGMQNLIGSTNDIWVLQIDFTVRSIGAAGVASIVTLGVFTTHKTSNNTSSGFSFNTLNNSTFDTTIDNTLDITVEWDTNSGSNSIYSDIFVLNKIY